MKRFSFLLLVSLLGTFHACAQTHSITAGQTHGMIFTDYVPDKVMMVKHSAPLLVDSIDLNHDSQYDLEFRYDDTSFTGGGVSGGGFWSHFMAIPLSNKIELAYNNDSMVILNTNCVALNTPLKFCEAFKNGETMSNRDSMWADTAYIFFIRGSFSGCYSLIYRDTSMYVSGRMLNNNDTVLFYLHLIITSTKIFISDYAIEGQESTIVINSINNLSSSNISISPNPFTTRINISLDKLFDYRITDYIGRVVLEGKAERIINTEQLQAGNYLLLIKNEETYSVKKIIKINP